MGRGGRSRRDRRGRVPLIADTPDESDSGPPRQGSHGRERRCVACGEAMPEDQLVRVVADPDGVLTPDVAARLPGRGVWVRSDRQSLELALRRNAFARSLKTKVVSPADLAERVEQLLARRCLDLLGLAQRAGGLAVGATRAEEALRRMRPHWLIEASDGAPEGRRKMVQLAFGLWGVEPKVTGCFSSGDLGVALGRAPVIHAVLLDASMAQRWTVESGRLAGFRAIVPSSWPPPL